MIKINLLSRKERRKSRGVKQELLLSAVLLLIVAVGLGFLWSWQNRKVEKLTLEQTQKQQQLDQLKKVVAEVEQFKKDKALYEQKIDVIAQLEKQQGGPVHLLDELSLNITDNLWFNNLSLNGDRLTISGSAFANISIVDFVNNLKNSPYFAGVNLQESKLAGNQGARVYVYTLNSSVTVPSQ